MNTRHKSNEYADTLTHFHLMPKAVLAAIAVSFALALEGTDETARAVARIRSEWDTLHANGIVPQKPAN